MTRLTTFALLALCVLLVLSPSEYGASNSLVSYAAADESAIEIDPETVSGDEGKCAAGDKGCEKKADSGEDSEEGSDVTVEDEEGEDADVSDDEDEEDEEDEEEKKDPDAPAVIDPEGKEDDDSYTAPKCDEALFCETFSDRALKAWKASAEGDYNGEFKVGQGKKPTIAGDRGLIIPQKARKYGISAAVKGLEDMSKVDNVVIQYEVKMEEGQTCGGAYLKLPLPKFNQEEFSGNTPYSIMFGPDKCGATNKVHFIFQSEHKNKKTEHHLKKAESVPFTSENNPKTNLYTLIINNKESSYEILIDNESKSKGSLEDAFDPNVQVAEKIPDPNEKKPKDWVDKKKIPDPKAEKPEDWDEDAPKEIVDEKAVKPDDWEDDTPLKIADPDANKPEDWDDSEDGAWDAPQIDNPRCAEISGCGEWKKPMIKNPDYKGKWKAPLIDNPDYIGPWKAKEIDNPDYYKVDKVEILPIGGVALELWTMDQGIVFDNIYIGTDKDAAKKFAEDTWAVKNKIEKEIEEKEKEEMEKKQKEEEEKEGADDGEEDGEDGEDDEDEPEDDAGDEDEADEEEGDEKDEL